MSCDFKVEVPGTADADEAAEALVAGNLPCEEVFEQVDFGRPDDSAPAEFVFRDGHLYRSAADVEGKVWDGHKWFDPPAPYDVMGTIDREGIEIRLGTLDGEQGVQIVSLALTDRDDDRVLLHLPKQYQVFQLIHALLTALEEA